MNKDQEIKNIEIQQRALADRLAVLREREPKREPRPGDVWLVADVDWLFLIDSDLRGVHTTTGRRTEMPFADCWPSCEDDKIYIGHFDDVYMLRAEAPEAKS